MISYYDYRINIEKLTKTHINSGTIRLKIDIHSSINFATQISFINL